MFTHGEEDHVKTRCMLTVAHIAAVKDGWIHLQIMKFFFSENHSEEIHAGPLLMGLINGSALSGKQLDTNQTAEVGQSSNRC